MQIFLGGKPITLEVAEDALVEDVKLAVEAKEGTPAPLQRLLYAGRQLADGRQLGEYGVAAGATLTLALRLRGGKGGFGSLLRGAGKAKLIDNFDACRDLQGRRIRHKTAEKKLAEWQAAAATREAEKAAARAAKEREKAERRAQQAEVDVQAVRQEHKESLQGVLAAVHDALATAPDKAGNGAGARRQARPGDAATAVKRRRIAIDPLAALGSEDEEMSSSESEDEEQVVATEELPHKQQQLQQPAEQTVHAAAKVKECAKQPGSGNSHGNMSSGEHVSTGEGSPATAEGPGSAAAGVAVALAASPPERSAADAPAEDKPANGPAGAAGAELARDQQRQQPPQGPPPEPIEDLLRYETVEALEVEGLERLKATLQRHGLKCGGTLRQRAERLFLLKSTPVEQMDKKHLAAPAKR